MNNEDPYTTPGTTTNPSPSVDMEPIEQPMANPSASPQTDPIAFGPDPIIVGEKKSKIGIIVATIVGILIIASGVFSVLWYINFTKPETVALDAITKLANAQAIKGTGIIEITANDPNDLGITNIKIRLDDASSSILPASSSGAIIIGIADSEISLDINIIALADGNIYFQLSGVTEVLEGTLPADFASTLDLFEAKLSEFDSQWYEVDIINIAALFGATIDSTDYDCFFSALASLGSDPSRTALVDAYTKHPLIALEKTDTQKNSGTGYSLSIDADQGLAFTNFIKFDTPVLDQFQECNSDGNAIIYDQVISQNDQNPLDDIDATLYITYWGHELTALDFSYESATATTKGTLEFSYPDSVQISIPFSSKPLSVFLEDLLPKISLLPNRTLN